MTNVDKLLQDKGREVWVISPEATVFDAVKLMDEKGVGALAVVQGDKLVGVISERDYARKVILKDRVSKQTRVQEIMTREVLYTSPQDSIESSLALMSKHHIRHLPVLRGEQLVGMISMGDVVKEIITQQQYKIENLEHTLSWGESY